MRRHVPCQSVSALSRSVSGETLPGDDHGAGALSCGQTVHIRTTLAPFAPAGATPDFKLPRPLESRES
jgi:hypothetical protein